MYINLQIDYLSWFIFGVLFSIFPKKALKFMTTIKLDNVHIHMMRAFGFLCIYSSLPSYIIYQKIINNRDNFNNFKDLKNEISLVFKCRIIISLLILVSMFYTHSLNSKWSNGHYYGMLGLILNIINSFMVLINI